MATEINEFFSQVGTNLASKIAPLSENDIDFPMLQRLVDHHPPTMEFNEITDYDVAILIRDLKPSSSCGADGITARLLRAAGPSIYPIVRHLINRSIITRQFPRIWKIGCITPLYKDGDATNPSNYRPISILPTMGKITEKIVHMQLYSYFSNYDLLSPCQAGFRKGHSTGTCLLDFVDNLFANIDRGMTCGVLFLDLRKAFDTVDHKILLTKLCKYGLKWNAVKWIESYLEGRQQVTKIDGEISPPASVTYGVPQGSILGPLLFTIYVNDIPKCIHNAKINLYADDTAIAVHGLTIEEVLFKLESVMTTVSKWFRHNKLSVNFSKTKYMLFAASNKKLENVTHSLSIGNERVERVYTYKYLGVKLDQTLNFAAHIEYIRSKTIGKIRLLGKIALILNQNTSLYLYRSLVLPIFDYADYVWDCLTQQDTLTLQKLQNMALKNILNVPRLTPTDHIHTTLKQDRLENRRRKHTAACMYDIHHGTAPRCLNEMFIRLNQIHNRQTRRNNDLNYYVPRMNLEMSKHNFKYRGSKFGRQYRMR